MPLAPDGQQNRPMQLVVESLDAPIPILTVLVRGETYPRFALMSNGTIRVGTGGAAPA